MFVFGLIVGLLLGIIAILTVTYLKTPIEKIITRVEKQSPYAKGGIIQPFTEDDEAREKIRKKNEEKGEGTLLEDLM